MIDVPVDGGTGHPGRQQLPSGHVAVLPPGNLGDFHHHVGLSSHIAYSPETAAFPPET